MHCVEWLTKLIHHARYATGAVRSTIKKIIPMHEIICPHCSKAFKIDEAGYADILKQVRDGEFEQEKRDAIVLVEVKGRAVLLTNS